MNDMSVSSGIFDELIAKGSITEDDVLRLRREVWRDGVVSPNEVDAVFRLDQACASKDATWTRFYVDALAEYFVWRAEPRKYVSEENARFLLDRILRDGKVDGESELELLINVVHWSISCPEELAMLALDTVRRSILEPATAPYGSNRPPAVIGAGDVEIIRKIIYAPGSPGGLTVTRAEAELMFELHNATAGEENAPGWGTLFRQAIANFLMFPRGAPVAPSAEKALALERFRAKKRNIGEILKDAGRTAAGMGKAAARGDVPVREAAAAILDPYDDAGSWERLDKEAKDALKREAIDKGEAEWLMRQMAADGQLHEHERALLAFIKENATRIDPLLQKAIEMAGI